MNCLSFDKFLFYSILEKSFNCKHKCNAHEKLEHGVVGVVEAENSKQDSTKTGPFCCYMCLKLSFKSKRGLSRHMNLHVNKEAPKKMKRCEICGKIPRRSYENHMKMRHSSFLYNSVGRAKSTGMKDPAPEIETFYCDMCPTMLFKSKRGLSRHMNIHVNKEAPEKMRRCEICGKIPRRGYEYHMKIRHSNLRFNCDICHAEFKHKSTQQAHMLSHKGEKTFLCSICGMFVLLLPK